MAKLRSWAFAATLVATTSLPARAADTPLPLKKVRLYETGVGYFERTGLLGGKSVALPVPTGHLDDALKTLVVLSEGSQGSVAGVEFGSSVSKNMAKAMAGLPADEAPIKLHALLKSLKGAGVEVKAAGRSITGRLVELVEAAESDLEECVSAAPKGGDKATGCVMQKQPTLVLLTKAGAIERFRVSDVASVRPTDAAYAARLGSALDALSDRSSRVMRTCV